MLAYEKVEGNDPGHTIHIPTAIGSVSAVPFWLTMFEPLMSGETAMKSLTTARVDGQYFTAHCILIEPCDHVTTLTFELLEIPET